MNDIIKSIEAAQVKAEVANFHVGDTVKVYAKVKEGNRERTQVFEGIVLKRQHGGARETFTVRKTSNGVGVEKTWPLHSPNVQLLGSWHNRFARNNLERSGGTTKEILLDLTLEVAATHKILH